MRSLGEGGREGRGKYDTALVGIILRLRLRFAGDANDKFLNITKSTEHNLCGISNQRIQRKIS